MTAEERAVFERAANLILDSVEQVFEITAPNGRTRCLKSIVDVLDYYTIARDIGDVGGTR